MSPGVFQLIDGFRERRLFAFSNCLKFICSHFNAHVKNDIMFLPNIQDLNLVVTTL